MDQQERTTDIQEVENFLSAEDKDVINQWGKRRREAEGIIHDQALEKRQAILDNPSPPGNLIVDGLIDDEGPDNGFMQTYHNLKSIDYAHAIKIAQIASGGTAATGQEELVPFAGAAAFVGDIAAQYWWGKPVLDMKTIEFISDNIRSNERNKRYIENEYLIGRINDKDMAEIADVASVPLSREVIERLSSYRGGRVTIEEV